MAADTFEDRARRAERLTAPREYVARSAWDYGEKAAAAGMSAAAARIDADSEDEQKEYVGRRQPWQSEVWDIYDDVPEVRRSAQFMSDCVSRLTWFVGVRQPGSPDGAVLPIDAPLDVDGTDRPIASPAEQAAALDAISRLRSDENSLSDLMRMAALQVFLPGEGTLIGRKVNGEERFDIASIDQLVPDRDLKGRWRYIEAPASTTQGMPWASSSPALRPVGGSATTGELLPADAFMMRFWRRHPRFSGLADSAMLSIRLEAQELRVLTRAIMAAGMSRMGAGVFVVPRRRGVVGQDNAGGGTGYNKPSQVAKDIVEQTTVPVRDPGSAAAVAPYVLELDPDDCDKPRHIKFDRESGVKAEERAELIRRILQGLDVPLENILGLGDTSTYANARLVTEQTFDTHLAPLAVLLSHCWTVGYLYPTLRAAGIVDVHRFAVWFDPSQLVGRPGQDDAAIIAYDRDEVSGAYLRDSLGIPQEAAPDEAELAARAARAKEAASVADDDTPAGTSVTEEAADEAVTAAAVTMPAVSRLGIELARRDDALRHRLDGHIGAAMLRAVEKVGAQARTKTRGRDTEQLIATVDNMRVAAQLGPALVASLDLDARQSIETTLTAAEPQVMAWLAAAHDDSLRLAVQFGDIAEDDLVAIRQRQAVDRSGAWLLLLGAATTVASSRLFTPDPMSPPLGEFDAAAPMPPGPVRAALAVAGGATGSTVNVPVSGGTAGTGAQVPSTVVDVEGRPAGGIYTGDTALDAYRRVGVIVRQYRWLIGAPAQPFDPHERLSGLEFDRWDDPALLNGGPWPPPPYYYPGDHLGCQCSFELVLEQS